MDALKQKEYEDKINGLESQLKEFAEKERLAVEAQAKAEADAKEAEAKAAVELLESGVKQFCEQAISEGRMTPAIRETDEPIMFTLAKTNVEALKSFQQKYDVSIVPLGVVKDVDVSQVKDPRSQVFQDAEKYVKSHPKEFSGFTAEDSINKAVYLHSMGKIKFENTIKNKE